MASGCVTDGKEKCFSHSGAHLICLLHHRCISECWPDWKPSQETLEKKVQELELQIDETRAAFAYMGPQTQKGLTLPALAKGAGILINEARRLAQEEFAQIQRDLAEGERYNALGREENAKLKMELEESNRLNGEATEVIRDILANELIHSDALLARARAVVAEKRDLPVPIRPGCICGPEGKCDYHRVTP